MTTKRTNVTPIKSRPSVCVWCGLAGHTMSTCPDRRGYSMDAEREAA